jgi:hypothetical protein
MSGSRNTIVWNKLERLSLPARLLLLLTIVLVAYACLAPIAYSISGAAGLIAAAAAAGVCALGAALGMPVASLFRTPQTAMYGVAVSMLTRTALPLALGVALQMNVAWLAEAGFIYYLLAFYAVTLATETILTVAQIAGGSNHSRAV